MNDFDYDVMQKKRIARGAWNRKCGSKSKRCSLPSDKLTKKQWKERCGQVMSYEFGKPMVWKEFKEMPKHIQKEYIENLIQKFSITAADLARMLDVHPHTVYKLCDSDGINIKFTRGKRMNKEQKAAFDLFLGKDQETSEPVHEELIDASEDCSEQPNDPPEFETTDIVQIRKSRYNPMRLSDFNLNFDGEFNIDSLYNSLRYMIPNGLNVRLHISCEVVPSEYCNEGNDLV